ncbi:MAG: glycosyltransferase [Neisseriaceae bacterium]|nr:glycosyltransferase [Neisseriaceae bacterium]
MTNLTTIPKFSVLMSIYYKEDAKHFQEALESIWDKQTCKPDEIILIQDGPLTPELYSVIDSWLNTYPHIFKTTKLSENVGTGKAKNIGLNECLYDYVAIMDTDDLAVPDRFERQLKFLMNHPDVVLVGGQIIEFEGSVNNPLSIKKVPTSHDEIISYAKKRSPFNHPSTMYKRTVIQDVGGYQHHLLMEDYNLWIRILAAGYKTTNLDQVLVYMRSRKAMLGRRRGLVYIKSEWQMMQLKNKLQFQHYLSGIPIFILRSAPRLLPASLLNYVYSVLRSN